MKKTIELFASVWLLFGAVISEKQTQGFVKDSGRAPSSLIRKMSYFIFKKTMLWQR